MKQPKHFNFNFLNKIKPKNLKLIRKGKEVEEEDSTNDRRIRKIENNDELFSLMDINSTKGLNQLITFWNFISKQMNMTKRRQGC